MLCKVISYLFQDLPKQLLPFHLISIRNDQLPIRVQQMPRKCTSKIRHQPLQKMWHPPKMEYKNTKIRILLLIFSCLIAFFYGSWCTNLYTYLVLKSFFEEKIRLYQLYAWKQKILEYWNLPLVTIIIYVTSFCSIINCMPIKDTNKCSKRNINLHSCR